MSTRAILGSLLASAAVLIVGWQAGTSVIATQPPSSQPMTSGTAPSSSTAGSGTPSDGTFTGSSVSTRFGDVQVSVTVSGGTIADVTALRLTDADGKSVRISNRAEPILRDEVIASQSANVSNVGGATYTTRAYLSSVQSALDQAGL